ncbi:MAG: flagellar biosynthetic protein FliO [Deltaproteobacteria bacterium]|nr:flagellar biosynthetic protein FliO [Deltaproteobacteria bacterium]
MRQAVAGLLLLFVAASPGWAGRAVVDWKDGVQLLSAPGPRAKRVGHLGPRVEVETLEERDGWVRIRSPQGEGWVKRRSLRAQAEAPSRAAPERSVPAPERPEPAEKALPAETPAPPQESPPAPAAAPQPAPSPAAAPAPAPAPGGYLSQDDREPPPTTDSGPGIFSVLSALLLVLALVAGAVWLFRIFSGRRSFGTAKGRGIQVLASRALGPRQALVLVEVGGLPLLLAQGEGGVHLIAEIRDPEAVRRLNDLYGVRETPFEAELHRQLDLESGEEGAEGPQEESTAPLAHRGGPEPTPEERLAALRRRRRAGEEP